LNIVIAASFSAAALMLLVILILVKPRTLLAQVRKFLIATSAIYLSGTLLILIFAVTMDKLPPVFVVISEVSIMFVFGISIFTILRISRNVASIMRDVEEGKIKAIEDEEDKYGNDTENED